MNVLDLTPAQAHALAQDDVEWTPSAEDVEWLMNVLYGEGDPYFLAPEGFWDDRQG